jgi:transposase
MRRYALRDDQWARIKDFLPGREGHVGGTAADNRLFVEAVLFRFRAGIPWRDLPQRFGDWKIVYQRFNRWAKDGVFGRIFKDLASDHDNEYMMIDSTIVRAHQHSAGARKKRPASDWPIPRRTEHENSCAGRRSRQSRRVHSHPRTRQRSHLRQAVTRSCQSRSPYCRQGIRRRCLHQNPHRAANHPGDSFPSPPHEAIALRFCPLLRAQPRRALLQQTQALSRHRNALRQARQKFSRRSSLGLSYHSAELRTGPSTRNHNCLIRSVSRAQHEVVRCSPGTAQTPSFLAVPDQQCTAQPRAALHPGHESDGCESKY